MTRTVQRSLRIPLSTAKAIEAAAQDAGKDFSRVANELIDEALRLRRCPGIVFAVGPSGRRPIVAGTGIGVGEIVEAYRSVGRSFRRLRRAFDWLEEHQLRAALGYYQAYPEEIEAWIARNESWTPERLAAKHPALAADEA